MADAIPLRPVTDATVARLEFQKVVAGWVKFMERNSLRSGTWQVRSRGIEHTPDVSFEVGVHADAFEALGWEVVSHAFQFAKTATGDVTITSLFVRKRSLFVPTGERINGADPSDSALKLSEI